MLVVNLVGGPGSGKSTTSAYIFAKLKMKGYKTDLVGEEARGLIYNGAIPMLENQILILGQQWQRITRLAKAGADVAICDSPLVLSIMYSQKLSYHKELAALVRKIEPTYPAFNIFVRRVKPFNTFGRVQKNVEQAQELDQQALSLISPVHLSVTGDEPGALQAFNAVEEQLITRRDYGFNA